MKNPNLYPQDQVYWYLNRKKPNQLKKNIKTDVVVIGGGMAGLSAAQSFSKYGYSVVLVEKYFCGAGASGKSSGFITPDSEFDLTHLGKLFGFEPAKKLWEFVTFGAQLIRKNIKTFSINCDHKIEDTVIVANSKRSFAGIEEEYHTRSELGYESVLLNNLEIQKFIGSTQYAGGIYCKDSFGIDAYLYCQAMKEVLENAGVKIFEETPALKINANSVETPHGIVEAEYIIVCVDRFLPELNKLSSEVFQAQTFLLVSEPLSEHESKKIFPDKNLMVWDNDVIYQYYRIITENRFLVGGSDLISIFWGKEQHNLNRMYKKLSNYAHEKFPDVKFNFKYFWPGLIGVSKDIIPIAGQDVKNPNIYYITAASGLPWATALGWYSAEKIKNQRSDFDEFFSPTRKFPIGRAFEYIFGKRITFSLSNLITLFLKT